MSESANSLDSPSFLVPGHVSDTQYLFTPVKKVFNSSGQGQAKSEQALFDVSSPSPHIINSPLSYTRTYHDQNTIPFGASVKITLAMNTSEKGSKSFSSPDYDGGDSSAVVVEVDQESNGSSAEDVESPRSVTKVMVDKWKVRKNTNNKLHLSHSQILRIRAEDSHLGEDIGEGNLCLKDKFVVTQFVVFSRPILPASPLRDRASC